METITSRTISKLLSYKEMMGIKGGDQKPGFGGGKECAANKDYKNPDFDNCFETSSEAMEYAGDNGHWECNTEAVRNFCK